MISVTRSGSDFDLQAQVINKRPDEAAQELLDLRDELDRLYLLASRIYESGDYSQFTECLLSQMLKIA